MKVGIDVDGVLADFNTAFMRRVVNVTGRDLWPENYQPTTWSYPTTVGYTPEEEAVVWKTIKEDRVFWYCLPTYPETWETFRYLDERIKVDRDDVYFITARPGAEAKRQTEMWLLKEFNHVTTHHHNPTVLITPHKGLAAQTLGLDVYIDDRYENALDAAGVHWRNEPPRTMTFLLNRPWNTDRDVSGTDIIRVDSLPGICEMAEAIRRGTAVGTTPCSHASVKTPA